MKHISKIADDAIAERDELRDKNAKLAKENGRLRRELQRVLGSDYADDICDDDDSEGAAINAALDGVGRCLSQ